MNIQYVPLEKCYVILFCIPVVELSYIGFHQLGGENSIKGELKRLIMD